MKSLAARIGPSKAKNRVELAIHIGKRRWFLALVLPGSKAACEKLGLVIGDSFKRFSRTGHKQLALILGDCVYGKADQTTKAGQRKIECAFVKYGVWEKKFAQAEQ